VFRTKRFQEAVGGEEDGSEAAGVGGGFCGEGEGG